MSSLAPLIIIVCVLAIFNYSLSIYARKKRPKSKMDELTQYVHNLEKENRSLKAELQGYHFYSEQNKDFYCDERGDS